MATQGIYDGQVLLDGTVTERKLEPTLQFKLNHRTPINVQTKDVEDTYERDGLPTPADPDVKSILDTVSAEMVNLTERTQKCEDAKSIIRPTLSAAATVTSWDTRFEVGQRLTLPGATGTDLPEPISIMITGELSEYIKLADDMSNYMGGQFSVEWIQRWYLPGTITGEIVYVSDGVYAISTVTFINSNPELTVDANEYYRFYESEQYFDIRVEGVYLYEDIEYTLTDSLLNNNVQVVPQTDWNSVEGGTLRVELTGDVDTRFIGNLVIRSSGISYTIEFGCAGPIPVDPNTDVVVIENYGSAIVTYDFGNVIVSQTETKEIWLRPFNNYQTTAQLNYTIPSDPPTWVSDDLSTAPWDSAHYNLTYAPQSGANDAINRTATMTFDDDPNNRYGWTIEVRHVGSGGEPALRLEPTESLNNDWVGIGDIINISVYGSNLYEDITYTLDATLNQYFSVTQVIWDPREGGLLRLEVIYPVTVNGIEGIMTFNSSGLTETFRITGVGDLDDNPKLIVESLNYYNPKTVGETWTIPVQGFYLTEPIDIAFPSNLEGYATLTKDANWNDYSGGTLTLTIIALPDERTVGEVVVSSTGISHDFEIGFVGEYINTPNPFITLSHTSPYDFGEVLVGESDDVTVSAIASQLVKDQGGRIVWSTSGAGSVNPEDMSLVATSNADRTEVEMLAVYTPSEVQQTIRITTITVDTELNDRYPYVVNFEFRGTGLSPSELIVYPEEYVNLAYSNEAINFNVEGIRLSDSITYELTGNDVDNFNITLGSNWSATEGGTLFLTGITAHSGDITLVLTVRSVNDELEVQVPITIRYERALIVSPQSITDNNVSFINSGYIVQVEGINLTDNITYQLSSSLTPYMTVTQNNPWDNLGGGNLYLQFTINFESISGILYVTSGDITKEVTLNFTSNLTEAITSNRNQIIFVNTTSSTDITLTMTNLMQDVVVSYGTNFNSYYTADISALGSGHSSNQATVTGKVTIRATSLPTNATNYTSTITFSGKNATVTVTLITVNPNYLVTYSPAPDSGVTYNFGERYIDDGPSDSKTVTLALTASAQSLGFKIASTNLGAGSTTATDFNIVSSDATDNQWVVTANYDPTNGTTDRSSSRTLTATITNENVEGFSTTANIIFAGTAVYAVTYTLNSNQYPDKIWVDGVEVVTTTDGRGRYYWRSKPYLNPVQVRINPTTKPPDSSNYRDILYIDISNGNTNTNGYTIGSNINKPVTIYYSRGNTNVTLTFRAERETTYSYWDYVYEVTVPVGIYVVNLYASERYDYSYGVGWNRFGLLTFSSSDVHWRAEGTGDYIVVTNTTGAINISTNVTFVVEAYMLSSLVWSQSGVVTVTQNP